MRSNHISTEFADHKSTIWCGQKSGYRMQYLPSIAVIPPFHGRFGAAVQTYYSYSTAKYGGVVVAPTFHLGRNAVLFAGVDI